MPRKRQPLKPDRPIASLQFSDTGKVRLRIEHPPRTQDELELRIGEKFLGALSHFKGRTLIDLASGTGRGDLTCRHENSRLVKIQVVEVVDPVQRILTARRRTYTESIIRSGAECLSLFSGCRISVIDSGNALFLPVGTSKNGQACVRQLLEGLDALANEIETLALGKLRHRKWRVGKDNIELGIICERFASVDSNVPGQLHFTGARAFLPGEPSDFVTDAVRKKIRKYYSKPTEEFWLLTYSTDTLRTEDDEDLKRAASLLEQETHPFDVVWYLYPYDNCGLGHLVCIWDNHDLPVSERSHNKGVQATVVTLRSTTAPDA